MKRFFLAVLILVAMALCSCATMNSSVPLVPPDPNLPEIKAFLGKWEGIWYDRQYTGSLAASLKIIKNEQGNINVIYSRGGSQEWKIEKGSEIKKPEFYRNEKGEMVLYFGKSRLGSNFEFWIDDGNLNGWIVGSSATIVMRRTTMNPLTSVPLPQIVQIVLPDPNLPLEIKAFSGKWGGRWWDPKFSGGLNTVLIIEKIDEHQATVVYGWGDSFEWNITEGWRRFEMNVSRNKQGQLVLSSFFSRERKLEVHLEKDRLEGVLGGSRSTSFITMRRSP